MFKEDYQAVLNLLHRVEVKGIQEAQALMLLWQKIEARIKHLDTPVVTAPSAAAEAVTESAVSRA